MKHSRLAGRMLAFVLAALLLAPAALAVDESQRYAFDLTVDGAQEKTVNLGDTVTVQLALSRTDSAGDFTMYALSATLRFHSRLFTLESVQVRDGVSCTVTPQSGGWEGWTDVTLNALASNIIGGDVWSAPAVLVTLKLKASAVGAAEVMTRSGVVSTASGMDSFFAVTNDIQITVKDTGGEGTEPDTPTIPPDEEQTPAFSDVPAGAWYEDAVHFVDSRDLFNGTSDTTFEPDTDMSRAMAATVLWRLDGQPAAPAGDVFADVAPDAWYTAAVRWAAASQVAEGYGNGLFGTEDSVRREEMAVFLYRYAALKGYDISARADLSVYPDVGSVSSWANDAMSWAVAQGILTGTDAGTLAPTRTASRAQVAVMFMRFVQAFYE